jgi:hypothetical protein
MATTGTVAAVAAVAKVLSNPLRIRVLLDADTWPEEGMSPTAWARLTGETMGNSNYAVVRLAMVGALVKTRTEQVRGTHENFYRPGPLYPQLRELITGLERAGETI